MTYRNRITERTEVKAGDLTDHAGNWRVHPEAQKRGMVAILEEVGIVDALTVYRNDAGELTIIDGHLRKSIDPAQTWPVDVLDVDDAEADKILATKDPLAAMAETERSHMEALMAGIEAESEAMAELLADIAEREGVVLNGDEPTDDPGAEVDRAAELQEKWQVERGQVWEIASQSVAGECHRLMCGDATDEGNVERLMGGEGKAALLITDPPYNVGVDYGESVDDNKDISALLEFSKSWLYLWQGLSERQIVTPGCGNLINWARWFDAYHIAPWVKPYSHTNGKVAHLWSWEPIFFFGQSWPRIRPNDIFEYSITFDESAVGHPCPKVPGLWMDLLESYCEEGDVILDAFAGSGTSFVVSEQTRRLCYGMEIHPPYVSVALERMADMGLDCRLAE